MKTFTVDCNYPVIANIWKVPAKLTSEFVAVMNHKKIRRAPIAIVPNMLVGYNYFYQEEKGYGDISKQTAERLSDEFAIPITDFTEGIYDKEFEEELAEILNDPILS